MVRNFFLDCGTHEGQGMCELAPLLPAQCEVHCFEPNPCIVQDEDALKQLASAAGLDFKTLKLHKEAIWTLDGSVEFVSIGGFPRGIPNGRGQSSSIAFTGNRNNEKGTQIPSVDLLRFLRELSLTQGDSVYIKMDIEGSEFDVVEKLISEGSDVLPYIKRMWIEWHDHYYGDTNCRAEDRERFIAALGSHGGVVTAWY